jgi:hypothetical protein
VFFQCFVAPKAQKVGSLKRQVRSHLVGWEIKNCLRLWREAHSEVKMSKTIQVRSSFGRWDVEKVHATSWREAHFEVESVKNWQSRTSFGRWDVEKVHAVVAGSIFPSQNSKNTPAPEHFWKLRCRKSAHRCGAKHISKSKVEKLRGSDHFRTFGCRFAW